MTTSLLPQSLLPESLLPPTLLRPAFRAPVPPAVPGPRPAGPDGPTGPVLPPAPREIVRSLAGRPSLWRPLVQFTEPRYAARLTAGPGWEAWLLTWLPGQSTQLHDHGGVSGAFAVLSGLIDESLPVRTPLRTGLLTRRYRAGQVRCFGSDHVHDVAARAGRRAVTLHVYTPRLTTMTRYALEDGELVVTSREQEGQDW